MQILEHTERWNHPAEPQEFSFCDLNIPMYMSQGIRSNIIAIMVVSGKYENLDQTFQIFFIIDSEIFQMVQIYLYELEDFGYVF